MSAGGSVAYTVGHSTRSGEELVALLERHGVELLVDVRRWPGSRRHPQFDRDALAKRLAGVGMDYRHLEALGGYREPAEESPNGGWESEGFRGYADHLLRDEARRAVESLAATARERTLAVMCAEGAPWRCHRQILADWLVAAGLEVRHILGPGRAERHELREIARVAADGGVIYPPAGVEQGDLFGGESG